MGRRENYPDGNSESAGQDRSNDYPGLKGRVPAVMGDVLILETHETFTIYVVGVVVADWQRDFQGGQLGLTYEANEFAARTAAKHLATSGSRVFLRNLETGEWLLLY